MKDETPERPDNRSKKDIKKQLADRGDLLGLLARLEKSPHTLRLETTTALLNKCIGNRAKDDLSGLCDDVFARIISMATLFLIRTQFYINKCLVDAEAYDGHAESGLPADIVDGGWMERAERISRFISEMASARTRMQHVEHLNAKAKHKPIKSNVHSASPMDENCGPARNGEGMSFKERGRCSETRFEFP